MENPNLVNAAYVIEMLRKHGLLSGMELGYFHAGWCDEAADLLENTLATIRELTESLDRVQKQCGEIIVECDERDAERLQQVAKLNAERKDFEIRALRAEKQAASLESRYNTTYKDYRRVLDELSELTEERRMLQAEHEKAQTSAVFPIIEQCKIVRNVHDNSDLLAAENRGRVRKED